MRVFSRLPEGLKGFCVFLKVSRGAVTVIGTCLSVALTSMQMLVRTTLQP